ncbi:HEPN/Toprim-associated domain-containing protein [Chloroflexota bacterium]
MGSYSELRLGTFILGSVKDDIDPRIMTLFRNSDKRINQLTPARLTEHGFDIDELEENEIPTVVQYVCSASVARDRLELMGFTREVAEAGFNQGLKEEVARYEEWVQSSRVDVFKETLQVLRELSLDNWLANLGEIRQQGLKPTHFNDPACKGNPPLLNYMLVGHDWYGFPGIEYRHFIRLLLDVCSDADELVYDLTDLVLGGWVEESGDLVKYADELISDDFVISRRIIVLTEGITDKCILERSLRLLYPHLSDYFRFMDFTEAKAEGGAGALANTVKAFAGAGIINRVVALFDNDTAAEAAIQSLLTIKLPDNIVVMKYPDIELANSYPAMGPTGVISMNVNGLAGSIELYLGEDVLRNVDSNLTPVQWKGYDPKLRQYQGEILNKIELQNKFEQKLKACETDPTKVNEYDWEGLRAIWDVIRSAFHHKDAADILDQMRD